MKYINNTLISKEKVIIIPQMHPIVYLRPMVVFALFSFIFLLQSLMAMEFDTWPILFLAEMILGLVTGTCYIYKKLYVKHTEMAITNKRVVLKVGIFSVHSKELQWNKIKFIEVRQGIFGKLFGYGDVCFSGTGTSFIAFSDVKNPWSVKAESAKILSK